MEYFIVRVNSASPKRVFKPVELIIEGEDVVHAFVSRLERNANYKVTTTPVVGFDNIDAAMNYVLERL